MFLSFCIVSFHVGSGCYDAAAFATAVVSARSIFDLAVSKMLIIYFTFVSKSWNLLWKKS